MTTERRQFERHLLPLELEIRGNSKNGDSFFERTQLVDSYYEGQVVLADIIIPGTPKMSGSMNTRATVMRLEKENQQRIKVSIHFLQPFILFRKDKAESR